MPKQGELVINGIKNGRQYTYSPDFNKGGVAFYGGSSAKAEDLEAQNFAKAIKNKGKLYVLAEEAAAVTRILEGIYISAKTGKPHYFEG
jgi:predicted dehydrogenase